MSDWSPPTSVEAVDAVASHWAPPTSVEPVASTAIDTGDQVSRGAGKASPLSPQASMIDKFLAPWKGETVASLAGQNMFANYARYQGVMQDLLPDLEKQYDKGKADGSITEPFGSWMSRESAKAYQTSTGKEAPQAVPDNLKTVAGWLNLPKQIYDTAVDNPAGFVSNLIKTMVVDPQLMLLPQLGLATKAAKLGKVAEKTVRAGEVGAEFAGQSAAISIGRQLSDTGEVDPAAVKQEAASGLVAGMGLSLLHAAIEIPLKSAAKQRGLTATPENVDAAVGKVQEAVKEGAAPDLAVKEALVEFGLDEKTASEISNSVKQAETITATVEKIKEEHNATDTQGPKDQGSNGEGVPQGEGDQSVLRQRELGQDQGSGEKAPEVKVPEPDLTGTTPEGEAAAERTRRAMAKDDIQEMLADIADKNAPPDRSISAFLGANGRRTIEFPDPMDKEVFRLATASRKSMSGGAGKQNAALVTSLGARVQKFLDAGSLGEAIGLARQYHEQVMAKAKTAAEDGKVKVDGARAMSMDEVRKILGKAARDQNDKWNSQAGRADPKLLAALGLASATGLAVAALTQDKTKAIGAAVAAGLLPFAGRLVLGTGRGVRDLYSALAARPMYAVSEPFRVMDYSYNKMLAVARNYAQQAAALRPRNEALGIGREASDVRIRDYLQGIRTAVLKPWEQQIADKLRVFLDGVGLVAQNAGVIRELRENYLTGLYQKKPTTKWSDIIDAIDQSNFIEGAPAGTTGKSRFARAKVFDDYATVERLLAQGVDLGIIPLTKDPIRIAEAYAASVAKSIAYKQLVETLQKTPGRMSRPNATTGATHPIPLVVPHTPEAAVKQIVRGNAIAESQGILTPDAKEWQNKLQIARAPSDYVAFNHPSFEGLRVHKDLVPALKLLFDTTTPNGFSRALYNISMASKLGAFALSLFHAGSLAMVAGATLVPRMLTGLSRGWAEIPGAWRMLHEMPGPEVKAALADGLRIIHAPEDVNVNVVDRALNVARYYLGNTADAVGLPKSVGEFAPDALKAMAQWHTDVIFKMMWPTLKLATYNAEKHAAVARDLAAHNKDPQGHPLRDVSAMGREVADATNTLYGGLNWFELANNVDSRIARNVASVLFSPSGRRFQQMALMAPDWNIAALRAWTEGTAAVGHGVGVGTKRASDAMYRSYLLFSAMTMIGAGEAIQYQRTGQHLWENEDWSKVNLGDGRYMVLNKHFAEAIHAVTRPQQFVLNKMNLLPRETLAQILGKEYLTYGSEGLGGPPMQGGTGIGSRLGHIALQFGPITAKTMAKDPSAWMFGYLGVPVYGTKTEDRIVTVQEKAAIEGKDPEKATQKYLKTKDRFAENEAANAAAKLPAKDIETARKKAEAQGKDPDAAEAEWQAAHDKRVAAVEKYRAKQQSIAEWRASHAANQ